jgi:hypothetical protein
VLLRCTDEESAALVGAARRGELTPSGYAAEAAVAAARGSEPPAAAPWRDALVELMAARAQVHRFGSNVNQAVRALNATGEPPERLALAVALAANAVAERDEAAVRLARRLR